MSTISGAHALIKALEHEQVEIIFGVPGGAILPAYDPILDSPIRHILARHEQGAGHMAEGYAWATGRVGVTMVTSGPAATNLVTPLADALVDSVPMVAITGQVATHAVGNDAFQEAYTTGITMPATKHNYFVTDAREIPDVVHEAFHIAATGRPGPVLIDLPKDVLNAEMVWHKPAQLNMPGYKPTVDAHPRPIKEAIKLIMASKRPVLYVGGGIIKAGAHEELLRFAEATQIPVVTTLMGRGAIPDLHPLALGMPGMHGNYTAVTAIQKSDLLIAMGARFDDRVTGKVSAFAPDAKVIHVDIDPAEHGKVRRPDVSVVGDCRLAMDIMLSALSAAGGPDAFADHSAWRQQLSGWQEKHPLTYDTSKPGEYVKPQQVLEALRDACPSDTIVASGVGQHQMWTSQYWRFDHPYTWINSGGLGTMGFSIPAAIGAKTAFPNRMVWAVDGDGCFQMTGQELITASVERIPIKVALINNAYLGMVRQWQELFYAERYSEVYLSHEMPDYVKWAEAMGCVAFRVEDPDEIEATIAKANEINDRPVVIEFRCQSDEKVYPMVPAGGSNDDILVAPSQRGGAPSDPDVTAPSQRGGGTVPGSTPGSTEGASS